jgi:hypothetical protein
MGPSLLQIHRRKYKKEQQLTSSTERVAVEKSEEKAVCAMCVSETLNVMFLRIVRLMFSVGCLFSTRLHSSTPPASTRPRVNRNQKVISNSAELSRGRGRIQDYVERGYLRGFDVAVNQKTLAVFRHVVTEQVC